MSNDRTPSPDGEARLPPPRMTIAGNDPDRGHWWNEADLRAYGEACARAAIAGAAEPVALDSVPFLVYFDDYERRPEVIIGEAAARERFRQVSASWNAHLFVKVASNTRDDTYAKANAVLASPPPPTQAPSQEALTTCMCRWSADGQKLVSQCTLHEAWRDAIHDWARRAKDAERLLASRPAPAQPAPAPVDEPVDVPSPSDVLPFGFYPAQPQGQAPAAPRSSGGEACE
jgi:hypothetical protein